MSISDIVSLLAALGLGAILGAYFKSRFEHTKEVKEDIHTLKRHRYGSILMQMLTVIHPDRLSKTQQLRPDFKDINDIKKEIQDEMLNSIMFANDEVIKSISDFVKKPDKNTLISSAKAMRKDLWGKGTKINDKLFENLTIDELLDSTSFE